MALHRRAAAVLLTTGVAVTVAVAPASAQPVNNQAGLVNVNVELRNVTIEIPVTVAAALTLCDTNVNVLSIQDSSGEEYDCESFAEANG